MPITDRYQLGSYPVRDRDGQLYAEAPEPQPARSWSQLLREPAAGER